MNLTVKEIEVKVRQIINGKADDFAKSWLGPQWAECAAFLKVADSMTTGECNALSESAMSSETHRYQQAIDRLDQFESEDFASELASVPGYLELMEYGIYEARWGTSTCVQRPLRALLLRHLIGTGSYSRRDYDAITMAWRGTIGQIHPNDIEDVAVQVSE